jgi:hypothetical protein
MDITKAIAVGKLLTANFIFTGNVIEMPSLVVTFGRIINVKIARSNQWHRSSWSSINSPVKLKMVKQQPPLKYIHSHLLPNHTIF